jgi:hypothetical protein
MPALLKVIGFLGLIFCFFASSGSILAAGIKKQGELKYADAG